MMLEWGTKQKRTILGNKLRELIRNTAVGSTKDAFWKSYPDYVKKDKDARISVNAVMELSHAGWIEKQKSGFSDLMTYLFLAEGGFANCVNFVSFMLVLQGHDLYNFF